MTAIPLRDRLSEPSAVDFEMVVQGFQFVEAPRVDDSGILYFSDLTGGGLYRRSPGGPVETVIADRQWIGGAVLNEDGTVICSGKGGIVRVDDAGLEPTSVLSEIDGFPIIAVNDIEADDRGGLFGGTIDFGAVFERGETPRGGVFFHLSPAGEVRVLREGVVASNGIAYSPDRSLLYHSESTVGVWAYGLDADGMPRAPSLFAKLDDSDGLAVDAEGGVWVACWQTAQIVRFRADGVLDRRIALPFAHVVSLAFGGPDLCDLYVTTGGGAADPGNGGVVRLRTDVPGLRITKSRFGRPSA